MLLKFYSNRHSKYPPAEGFEEMFERVKTVMVSLVICSWLFSRMGLCRGILFSGNPPPFEIRVFSRGDIRCWVQVGFEVYTNNQYEARANLERSEHVRRIQKRWFSSPSSCCQGGTKVFSLENQTLVAVRWSFLKLPTCLYSHYYNLFSLSFINVVPVVVATPSVVSRERVEACQCHFQALLHVNIDSEYFDDETFVNMMMSMLLMMMSLLLLMMMMVAD